MSSERWIKLGDRDHFNTLGIHAAERWTAAEGQRVEEIYWCETHGAPAREMGCPRPEWECEVVEATLILPPQERSA